MYSFPSLLIGFSLALVSSGFAVEVRIVAANLTSGNQQAYSPDNSNHSNPEGAGARILKGLKPDVVIIQEFNTSIDTRQWVAQTFGSGYRFAKESGAGLPNGIISRFPIVDSGEWDDTTQSNRDFAWAKIKLPGGKFLWAISVHLKASNGSSTRLQEAQALVTQIKANIPAADFVVLGGDFNTANRNEPCVTKLGELFRTGSPQPADQSGNGNTNSSHKKPYDWVLADAELAPRQVATRIGPDTFPSGCVIDTRRFTPLSAIAPATLGDSGTPNMQHMAVVKDFRIP